MRYHEESDLSQAQDYSIESYCDGLAAEQMGD